MQFKQSLCLLSLAVLALSLTACGDKSGDVAATQPRDELRYASMKDIRNINPHLYLGEMAAQAMVFEPLVISTKEGIRPWLAESWTISEDGRTYTFQLRKGVTYSDGTPFDAQSVKLNIEAVLANKIRHAWLDFTNEIESVDAPDTHTFVLHLKHAYYPTLIELSVTRPFRFISPKCMQNGQTKDGVSCLIGTGPWQVAEHKPNQYAVFKQNPSYWGTKPKLRSIRWSVMPDAQTMLMALEKGEIDLIFGADGDQITSDAFHKLMQEGKYVAASSDPVASRAVLLNSNIENAPVTGQIEVREAIQRAVNRQAIVQGVLNNMETAAETLFAKNVPGCNIDLPIRPYDPDEAVRILEAAGWSKGADGIFTKNGLRCEVTFWFNANNAQEKTIAEAMQSDLRRVGIAMNIRGEEKQAFLDRQRTGKFDLQYSLSWGAPYDPQSYFSSWRIPAHGDYQAQTGLPDKAELDREITDLMTQPSPEKRQSMTEDIVKRIHAAAVYVPISYSRTKAVYRSDLKGVDFAVSQYEIPFEAMHFGP